MMSVFSIAAGHHDTAACWRPDRFAEQRYEGELFCGANYRMSELTGAVMLAQLSRLDGVPAAMRRNQQRIISQVRIDPGSAAAGALSELPGRGGPARRSTVTLPKYPASWRRCRGVFNAGIPDWHILCSLAARHREKNATPEGCPWSCPYHQGTVVDYAAAIWNLQTLAYLMGGAFLTCHHR